MLGTEQQTKNYLQLTLENVAKGINNVAGNVETHYKMNFKDDLKGSLEDTGNMILAKIFKYQISNNGVDSYCSGLLAGSGLLKINLLDIFSKKKTINLDSFIRI